MELSNIKKGSVVNIWAYPKGHNYVIAGEDTENRKLLLVKLNCLNNTGVDVHKATKRFHRSVSYTVVGDQKVVKGISRVLGHKDIENYDFNRLIEDYQSRTNSRAHIMNRRRTFVCSPVNDNRNSVSY